jgi:outer membrane protein OmpA-like peptidoglycan-associated protein/tetratricopeptide (TPR) repeat protein
MKSIRFALIFSLFTILSVSLYAQTGKTRSEKQFDKAVQLYNRHDFANALRAVDELIADDPAFAKAWLLKGDMFNDLKEYDKAVVAYTKAVEIDSTVFPPTYYIMANLYFDMEMYAEAKVNYLKYLAFNPKIQDELKRTATNMLLCDFRIGMMKNPVPFNPVNIGPNVNSNGYEYINAVSLDEGQLYFTRKGSDIKSDESFYRSISARSVAGQLNWSPAIEIGAPINTPGNEGALCVSPDGMTIIITCCSRRDSYGSCDLYLSHKAGNNWSEPENLGELVNSTAWESQPCLAVDGRTLFFVSTRRGGFGGSDIWKSVLQDDGYWGAPVNLGNTINTSSDEMAPFIHPDGRTLYFSSRGHMGLGGADLFVSRLDNAGIWQQPENIGYPVNTKRDEINLIINAKGTEAFISAERENGFGNIDIYRFELPEQSRPASVSYVQGKVYDKNTLLPLKAAIELIDMQKNTVIVNSTSDPITGEFLMSLPVDKDYAVNIARSGYLFYSTNFNVSRGNDSVNPIKLDIPMQPLAVGEKVVLHNIFFETDKFELLSYSQSELERLITFMTKNTTTQIEIGGHTDSEGSETHNNQLSQNRAKAVYDYLVSKGVEAGRLTFKGYGESAPIESNDTPEGRAKNRRTEFKVVSK